jgi:hypothetical protein
MNAAARHLGSGGGAWDVASFAARGLACLAGASSDPAWLAALATEQAAQCDLVRDLFGDPSVPFRFAPAWLAGQGAAAVALAGTIYRENRFDALVSLADLLDKSGCRDSVVLAHCRAPGPHARGCWVLDALLGHEPAVRVGLLTEADWQACADPEPLLHFLRDKGSCRKWRLFAVACCRRIAHLITDERSRRAVEVAARFADGAASEEEVEAARIAAQQAQDEAKLAEYMAEAEANFCETSAYAAACCRLLAAVAVRCAFCRDPWHTDAEPGSFEADCRMPSNEAAASAVGKDHFAGLGREQGDDRLEEARRTADAAWAAEQSAHCDLLRDLFGEHLGPVGEDGCWLPCGLNTLSQVEQWCLLPTPRKFAIRIEWLTWNGGTVGQIAQAIYEEEAFDRMPILADALEEAGCADADLLCHLRSAGSHARGCWALDAVLRLE